MSSGKCVVAIATLLASWNVCAETYDCVDSSNRRTVTDTPCENINMTRSARQHRGVPVPEVEMMEKTRLRQPKLQALKVQELKLQAAKKEDEPVDAHQPKKDERK